MVNEQELLLLTFLRRSVYGLIFRRLKTGLKFVRQAELKLPEEPIEEWPIEFGEKFKVWLEEVRGETRLGSVLVGVDAGKTAFELIELKGWAPKSSLSISRVIQENLYQKGEYLGAENYFVYQDLADQRVLVAIMKRIMLDTYHALLTQAGLKVIGYYPILDVVAKLIASYPVAIGLVPAEKDWILVGSRDGVIEGYQKIYLEEDKTSTNLNKAIHQFAQSSRLSNPEIIFFDPVDKATLAKLKLVSSQTRLFEWDKHVTKGTEPALSQSVLPIILSLLPVDALAPTKGLLFSFGEQEKKVAPKKQTTKPKQPSFFRSGQFIKTVFWIDLLLFLSLFIFALWFQRDKFLFFLSQPSPTSMTVPTQALVATVPVSGITPTPPVVLREQVRLLILNGSGRNGEATRAGEYLGGLGYQIDGLQSARLRLYPKTVVQAKDPQNPILPILYQDLSTQYEVDTEFVPEERFEAEIIVIIGVR